MLSVDLNCDMGESYGPWTMGSDAELMKYVSSVNIACGFHAGDPSTIRQTVKLSIENGLAIGAHPGYADRQGFGRRSMELSNDEIFDVVLFQVAALKGICEAFGGRLHHVKPHGALYNNAAKEVAKAKAIAEAVRQIDGDLILYGLSGSFLISEAEKFGLRTASEVFADRGYQQDGSLTPRSEPHALIRDAEIAAAQALQMIKSGTLTTAGGETIPIKADTICIHGDSENAVELAAAVRTALREKGIAVQTVFPSLL